VVDQSTVPAREIWPRYILSGHAKLPQDAAARSVYEILTIVVAVDPESGRVLDVGASLVTAPAREFLRQLLLGASLAEPPDLVYDTLQKYYWGGAKKALAAGIRDLYNSWEEVRRGQAE
jgi:hypothetical protein